MSEPLLEVLIPTYARPEGARRAIESCLAISDDRMAVYCHSNGPLEELGGLAGPRVRLASFPENRGPRENFRAVIEGARGTFCMLMSDEDTVNVDEIRTFLDHLAHLSDSTGVLATNVLSESGVPINSVRATAPLNLSSVLRISPLAPPYMSGWTVRRARVTPSMLASAAKDSPANAYGILFLRDAIMDSSRFEYYAGPVVRMGPTIPYGGDAFSHLVGEVAPRTPLEEPGLNPAVYGVGARAQQFFLQDQHFLSLARASAFSRGHARLAAAVLGYHRVMQSRYVESQEQKESRTLRQLILEAAEDARARDEMADGWACALFMRLARDEESRVSPFMARFLGHLLGLSEDAAVWAAHLGSRDTDPHMTPRELSARPTTPPGRRPSD